QRYSTTLKAAGGRPPYRWQNELPLPGVQLDASTGELSVEPGGGFSGRPPLCVSVADQDGNTERQSLTVTLRGLTILNSHFLPEAVAGVPYRTQFQAAGNSSPVSWETGVLGNGLQLNRQTGELSGTPAQTGAIVFEVAASDGSQQRYREFLLQVSAPATAAGPPRIAANGVVNGASFAGGAAVAPGSIISVFGGDLAVLTASATATPLPANLGGTSLTINNRPAPLFFVSPTQINAQLPFEISPGTATAVVTKSGQSSAPVSFSVAAAGPGILMFGTNRAVAQNQDYSINNTSNPARAGSAVTVYMTGQGQVDNPVASGAPAPASPLSRARLQVTATIGGRSAEVLFAGLTPGFVGLLQVNLRIPELSAGNHPVVVTIGGVASNSALITVAGN
ncbi:MAG: putative Ig domain-containing protein, partial [Acidobacteriota bacterium]